MSFSGEALPFRRPLQNFFGKNLWVAKGTLGRAEYSTVLYWSKDYYGRHGVGVSDFRSSSKKACVLGTRPWR